MNISKVTPTADGGCTIEFTTPDFVYVLTSAFDCEGEQPIGVHASLPFAKQAAEKMADACGFTGGGWVQKSRDVWELQYGSNQWVVRRELVRTGEVRPGSMMYVAAEERRNWLRRLLGVR